MNQDQDQAPPVPRRVRYAPKVRPRRNLQPTESTIEVADEGATAADEDSQSLLRRVNEHLVRKGPSVEKKSSVQVAFAHETASPTSIKSYGMPREGNSSGSKGLGLKDSAASDKEIPLSLPTAEANRNAGSSVNAADGKQKKEYGEIWDYDHTDYPVSLPWRRPYSGDPELLDEEEFGGAAMDSEYDEDTINPAMGLGLLEENEKPRMVFLQFPANLPLVKQSAGADGKDLRPSGSKSSSASAKGKAVAVGSKSSGDNIASAAAKGKETVIGSMPLRMRMGNTEGRPCSLEEVPRGYMGKMLVYKSGAIKWKLGDVIYDVSPGEDCKFAQDVAAINTVDKNCCVLGEIRKRAVVTPDIDSVLSRK